MRLNIFFYFEDVISLQKHVISIQCNPDKNPERVIYLCFVDPYQLIKNIFISIVGQ